MVTPNLIIAGFQKCASSSLFDLLVKHPDISGSDPKETYFLSDKGYDNFDYSKNITNPNASWNEFFPEADSHQYFLEGSVSNFYQENAKKYVKDRPGTKIVFILRDPVDRFISNYKYYYNKVNGIDPSLDIATYYEYVKQGKFTRQALKYSLIHGQYVRYLEEWKKIAGDENICIVGLKELASDHNAVMEKISNFLGLPPYKVDSLKRSNVSRQLVHTGLHRKLYRLFGGKITVPDFLRRLYVKLFSKEFSVQVDDNLRNEIKSNYAEEYASLSQYF